MSTDFDPRNPHERPSRPRRRKKQRSRQRDAQLLNQVTTPTGPFAEAYRIAGYADGLVGKVMPDNDAIAAHWDSGLKWPDPNNPLPTDLLWGGGVRAGLRWDGVFYRDLSRYGASGTLFWSVYLKPGSGPGDKNGFWFNFGKGYCHLQDDDPAQMLAGASPRLWWEPPHSVPAGPASPLGPLGGSPTSGEGCWHVAIEATVYVTLAKHLVWEGIKAGGSDPTGIYTRVAGCDPLPSLTVEAAA